jgi:hypothetical protein
MAINSIITTESISVFGPPEVIEVSLDIGAAGPRGSLIYSGSGDPNFNTGVFANEEPIVGDIYIRQDFGANYGVVYQYGVTPGGEEWNSVLKILPTMLNLLEDVEFISGTASVSVLLSDIFADPPVSLTANNFCINITPQHTQAVAISVTNKAITAGINKSLIFGLRATQQDQANGTTLLNTTIGLNTLISIV